MPRWADCIGYAGHERTILSTVTWYDDNADRLAIECKALEPGRVHGWLDGLLPVEPGVVFDIGCGTGRDATWLASLSHEVIGVEPSASMRAQAARLHEAPGLRWLDDSLPALSKLTALGLAADLILVSGVWQHVTLPDRPRAFRKLAALLRSGGVLAITLRGCQRSPICSAGKFVAPRRRAAA